MPLLALQRDEFTAEPLHGPIDEELDGGRALVHRPRDVVKGKIRGKFEPHCLPLLHRKPIDRFPDPAASIAPDDLFKHGVRPIRQMGRWLEADLNLSAAVMTRIALQAIV
jgi:hypothetical protein